MTPRLQKLHDALVAAGFRPHERLGEITLEVPAAEYLAAATKLRDELGWTDEVAFADGLVETVRWYADNREWWEPLRGRAPVAEAEAWR
jgi:nucleoside-diphosphate-sugar epimerase